MDKATLKAERHVAKELDVSTKDVDQAVPEAAKEVGLGFQARPLRYGAQAGLIRLACASGGRFLRRALARCGGEPIHGG